MRQTLIFAALFSSNCLALLARESPPMLESNLETKNENCNAPIQLNASTNIWAQYKLNTNKFYKEQVITASELIDDKILKKQALRAGDAGAFVWIEGEEDLDKIDQCVEEVACDEVLGIVLKAWGGSPCTDDYESLEKTMEYWLTFIHAVAAILKRHSSTAFAIILQPGLMERVILSLHVASCTIQAGIYHLMMANAMRHLDALPNIVMYVDAGHGGTLGWDDNRRAAANFIFQAYEIAQRPRQLRGFATNVLNYNSWDAAPGEFETTAYSNYSRAQNEQRYIHLLAKDLAPRSIPNHAIVDTSRNGVLGLRSEWTDWCNVNGAGFGMRPTSHTGDELADGFVWVKNGGVSDGTSDSAALDFVSPCGLEDSARPMPARGEWSQDYFEMLLRNARPSIEIG